MNALHTRSIPSFSSERASLVKPKIKNVSTIQNIFSPPKLIKKGPICYIEHIIFLNNGLQLPHHLKNGLGNPYWLDAMSFRLDYRGFGIAQGQSTTEVCS